MSTTRRGAIKKWHTFSLDSPFVMHRSEKSDTFWAAALDMHSAAVLGVSFYSYPHTMHLPGLLRPDERGDARATAQIHDQVRSGSVRYLQEHIKEGRRWSGTIGVVAVGKPRVRVTGALGIQYGIIRCCTHASFLQSYGNLMPSGERPRKRAKLPTRRPTPSAPAPVRLAPTFDVAQRGPCMLGSTRVM